MVVVLLKYLWDFPCDENKMLKGGEKKDPARNICHFIYIRLILAPTASYLIKLIDSKLPQIKYSVRTNFPE